MQLRILLLIGTIFAVAARAEMTFDATLRPQFQANNHIEFGISVDPSTVPESRESSQLSGTIWTLGGEIAARVEGDALSYGLTVSPAVEDYRGDEGFLDQYDAQRLPVEGWASYNLTDALPPLRLRLNLSRQTREAAIYDYMDTSGELGFGDLFAYEFRRREFDDTKAREDYLLISSDRQTFRSGVRLQLDSATRLSVLYRFQHEQYENNLSPLLLIAFRREQPDTPGDFIREDNRHTVETKLLRAFGESFLIQVGGSGLWNRANAAFYRFDSREANLVAFKSLSEGRWIRLEGERAWTRFEGRRFAESFGGERHVRKDKRWRGAIRAAWEFHEWFSLQGSLELLTNETNDSREVYDFLNYTQTIGTVAFSLRY